MSWDNANNMKEAMAAAKARKLKSYEWCRLRNDFTDMPIWRAVAQKTGVHLASVIAIVMRLEALANRSMPRGSVADMSIPEFAAALDLRPAVVGRVRTALEEPDIAWVDQDFVVDFHQRNPDHEDRTAVERQRRRRSKLKSEREQALMRPPPSGFPEPVTRDSVTVTRDTVTVTPRSDQNLESASASVLKSADASKSAGLAVQSPEQWLAAAGMDFVTHRLQITASLAEVKLDRWLRDLGGDAGALVEIIQGAVAATQPGRPSHFDVVITGGIRRWLAAAKGNQLPFGPMVVKRGGEHE